MGDHDDGGAGGVEVPEQLEDFVCSFSVQIAGGFIGQDDGGFVEEGAGDGDALLLAAGELVRHLVGFGSHAHGLQYFRYAGVDEGPFLPAGCAQHELQVALHGTVREQLEILEHDAHRTAEEGDIPAPDAHKVVSAGGGFPLVDGVFGRDGADDGGFSGTHLSYDVHEVSGLDVHVQRVDDYVFTVEDIGVFEMDERLLHG